MNTKKIKLKALNARKKLYEEIVLQIESLIEKGELKIGDRLPPERKLAEIFKVSRNPVREAIIALEERKLLQSRPGDGTYVILKEKDSLIAGKYRNIVTQELTNFYDEKSRNVLEKIIAQKFALRERNFFMFATLEEEIRKVAKLAGADYIRILKADVQAKTLLDSAKSIIRFYVEDDEKSNYVKKEIRDFLESKNYLVQENKDSIYTNANLFQE